MNRGATILMLNAVALFVVFFGLWGFNHYQRGNALVEPLPAAFPEDAWVDLGCETRRARDTRHGIEISADVLVPAEDVRTKYRHHLLETGWRIGEDALGFDATYTRNDEILRLDAFDSPSEDWVALTLQYENDSIREANTNAVAGAFAAFGEHEPDAQMAIEALWRKYEACSTYTDRGRWVSYKGEAALGRGRFSTAFDRTSGTFRFEAYSRESARVVAHYGDEGLRGSIDGDSSAAEKVGISAILSAASSLSASIIPPILFEGGSRIPAGSLGIYPGVTTASRIRDFGIASERGEPLRKFGLIDEEGKSSYLWVHERSGLIHRVEVLEVTGALAGKRWVYFYEPRMDVPLTESALSFRPKGVL